MCATPRSRQPEPTVLEPVTELRPLPPKRRRGINESRRHHAIHEVYCNLGEPEESEWAGRSGSVSKIRQALGLRVEADRCTYKALQQVVVEGDEFDGGREPGAGAHVELSLAEAMIAAEELESGVGQSQATVSVNVWRSSQVPSLAAVPNPDCSDSLRVKQEKWAGYAQFLGTPL